jgi:tRNA pseudouridine38-40 synthase
LRERARGGITAPPDGLYLVHIAYPPQFGLPGETALPRYG